MFRLFLGMLLPLFLYAQSGKLMRIIDGDTVVLLVNNKNIICQMANIDTPELVFNAKLKREMKKCNFSKQHFIEAGKLSYDFSKTILKIGQIYKYDILGYTRSKNPVCRISIPKGLHVELRPTYDELMVSRGYALPYIIKSNKNISKQLLKVAKDAKEQKIGLWKNHFNLMKCLVEYRYSLRSLR